eukprot:EG_transcript_10444
MEVSGEVDQRRRQIVHVEGCVRGRSTARYKDVREAILQLLEREQPMLVPRQQIAFASNAFLVEALDSLVVSDAFHEPVPVSDAAVQVDVYQLNEDEPYLEEASDDVGDGAEETPACEVSVLPNKLYHGLWESLIFEGNLKAQLVDYMDTAILFSERKVNPNLISFNRVLLLHGPPGTGKTSLCKALSQQMAIRLGGSDRFERFTLAEINSHSLFSKWFSESGKLVGKIFRRLREYAEDEGTLTFILLDEVESLAAARKCALAGAEPSDALRVVNALLTQLDQLRRLPNVFVMATSNITEAIDVAFLDRADLKIFVPMPSANARWRILSEAIVELINCGLMASNPDTAADKALERIAHDAEGLSGRMLRKLPFLAFARIVQLQAAPYSLTTRHFST